MKELVRQDIAVDVAPSTVKKWQVYSVYKDSGIEWLGEIPEHWEAKKLKFIAAINSEVLPEDTDPDYLLQYVDISNVDSQGLIVDVKEMQFKIAPSRARRLVKHNDIIISTVRTYLRAISYIQYPPENLVVSTGFAVLRPYTNINAEFLWRLIQSDEFVSMVVSQSQGVSYPAITPNALANLVMWLPPPLEQRLIASFLDRETSRINALIAKEELLIEFLQEKRAAIISQAVTKGLHPDVPMKDSGVEWLGMIPGHWEIRKLKFVTSFITSGSRGWAQYYSDEGALFLRIGNLSRTSIDLDLEDPQYVQPPQGTEGERTRVYLNDILISITAYIGSIGVISKNIGDAYVNQHIALTRPRQDIINAQWLGYCLLSRVGQDQFRMLLYGGTKEGLNLDDVANLMVILPPLSEQQTIVAYLDQKTAKIDALISRIREGIQKLQEDSSALISAAVTGKINVREAVRVEEDMSGAYGA